MPPSDAADITTDEVPRAPNPIYTPVEIERLNLVHRMETSAIGDLCWQMDEVRQVLAPREGHTTRILDVGSGSGTWVVEMAREFPHAEVVGIDNDPKFPSDVPSNCRFEAMDLLRDNVDHLQARFDLVRCSKPQRWVRDFKPILERILRIIKPGGLYFEIDGDSKVYDEKKQPLPPAYVDQTPGGSWVARMLFEYRKHISPFPNAASSAFSDRIEFWLGSDPLIESVKAKHVYIPLGWPGSAENDISNQEEAGQLAKLVWPLTGRALRPVFLAGGMAAEEADLCIREAEAEVSELRVKSYLGWHFHVARVKN